MAEIAVIKPPFAFNALSDWVLRFPTDQYFSGRLGNPWPLFCVSVAVHSLPHGVISRLDFRLTSSAPICRTLFYRAV